MKEKIEAVKQASHKLAEEIYKEAGAQAQQGGAADMGGAQGGSSDASSGQESPKSGSVDDVDFEVVDDEDDK